jgi:hypothetical protein
VEIEVINKCFWFFETRSHYAAQSSFFSQTSAGITSMTHHAHLKEINNSCQAGCDEFKASLGYTDYLKTKQCAKKPIACHSEFHDEIFFVLPCPVRT